MYLIQYTAFLILLFHECDVNGFNIFDIDLGFNYLNREFNSSESLLISHEIKERWIPQEIDHFNASDKRKWNMKYYENLQYWKENGPIIVSFSPWFEIDFVHELVTDTHGAFYYIGHRYYGENELFANLDAENIKYLSSQQALADVSKIITYLKSLTMYKKSKVIVIGNSYATWIKVLYPELIDAAISSSAPVLAKKDFYEFHEKVKHNYEHYGGTECVSNIEKIFENYDSLLQSPEGIDKLKKDMHICDACNMTILENQQLFFFLQSDVFRFLSTHQSPDTIKGHCENLNDFSDYTTFLSEHSKVYDTEKKFCFNYDFNQLINNLKEDRNFIPLYRELYQKCTEFGHFPTTTSNDQPFLNIPLEFYIKICTGLFGTNYNEKKIDEGVDFSNKLYGGLKPNVTKVVFTNGDMDPWSTISVLKDLSGDAPAVVIPGVSNGRDLFPKFEDDSDELQEARSYVKYLIKKWIRAGEHF